MTNAPTDDVEAGLEAPSSWAPMVCLFLAQVLMSFNVAALPVSLGGMVEEFGVTPTVGFVIGGQLLAGASAAIIVPALVALIAENYHGPQQATAIGSLGSARAISGVSAFLIGGTLGTLIGWRPVFVVVLAIAAAVFLLSFRLRGDHGNPEVRIDLVGAVLIGVAIVALTMGFNNLNGWGLVTATDTAPFAILGLSPAPVLVVLGIVFIQLFWAWTRARTTAGRPTLVDLSIIGSGQERAAVFAMFIIVGMEGFVNFTIPLYIQIVQGRTPFDTSIAMMPFNLTVFITATLVVRFCRRYPPRIIGVFGFCLTTVALCWLAFVVNNNWETLPTILGLIVFGIGQGALVTLVFNVLVTAAPVELAGDVGSLRGTTQNLASAVGTAVAGALLVCGSSSSPPPRPTPVRWTPRSPSTSRRGCVPYGSDC